MDHLCGGIHGVLAVNDGAIAPWLMLLLCIVGGVSIVLLLPGRSRPLRAVGTLLLLASGGIFIARLVLWTIGNPGGAEGMGYIYFWLFAVLALVGSVRVITHPQPVYSALYFVLTVFASAGLFVLLWAEFMAAALVLIYAGAILVTYVFVIMLAAEASPTRAEMETGARSVLAEHDLKSREPVIATITGFALLGVLLGVILAPAPELPRDQAYVPPLATRQVPPERQFRMAADVTPLPVEGQPLAPRPIVEGSTQTLGFYLFTEHLVSLQLAGLLLTISMIGAIVIARKKILLPELAPARIDTDVLRTPATPVDDNPHSIPVSGTRDPRQKAYPET